MFSNTGSQKRGAHGWNSIHLAAAHGDEASLRKLIQSGDSGGSEQTAGEQRANVPKTANGSSYKSLDVFYSANQRNTQASALEEPTSNGDRALHVAVRNGQVHAAKILVAAGADITARGNNGETVIHICAELDLTRELEWLKSIGDESIISSETDDGKTAAHYAAAGNRVSVLEWLRKSRFTSQFVSKDHFGDTPLHLAARSGSDAAADWLIAFANDSGLGRSLLAGNNANKDPAMIAKESGYFAIARSIEKAKISQQSARRMWRTAGGSFLEAAREGNIPALKALLEANDPSLIDYKHHKTSSTATLQAATHGHLETLKWLLSQPGRRVNVNSRSGNTLLHVAARDGHLNVVKFCVADTSEGGLGIDPSRTTALGATAAQLALKNGKKETHDWLINLVQQQDRGRRTAPAQSTPKSMLGSNSSPSPRFQQDGTHHNLWATPPKFKDEVGQHRNGTKSSDSRQSSTSDSRNIQRQVSNSTVVGDNGSVSRQVSFSTASFSSGGNGSASIIGGSSVDNEQEQRELAALLHELGLLEWLSVLCEDGFDSIKHILNLLEGDLISIGMKKGHRRALLHAVDQLKAQQQHSLNASLLRASSLAQIQTSNISENSDGMNHDQIHEEALAAEDEFVISQSKKSDNKRRQAKKKTKKKTRSERRNAARNQKPKVNPSSGIGEIVGESAQSLQRIHSSSSTQQGSESSSNGSRDADGLIRSSSTGPFGIITVAANGDVSFSNSTETLKKQGKVLRCSCKRWKQQLGPFEKRVCEHIIEFLRHDSMGEFNSPEDDKHTEGVQGVIRKSKSVAVSKFDRSRSSQDSNVTGVSAEETDEIAGIRRVFSDPSPGNLSDGESPSIKSHLAAHHILQWNEIQLGFVIGEGSFGIVRGGVWRGMHVAVKELRISTLVANPSKMSSQQQQPSQGPDGTEAQAYLEHALGGLTVRAATPRERSPSQSPPDRKSEQWDLRHEAVMLSRVCNHENIVPFLGVVLEPRPSVVTRLMPGGSVDQMLVSPGPKNRRATTSFAQMVQMMVDAAAGVLHLHREGVIHRDLAARNLLVDEHGRVRLSDFGFARVKEQNASKGYTSQHIGPIKWMSPEALRFRQFSECSDVFGFGVTLYEVITGNRPWEGVETMDVVFRVCNGERLARPYGSDPSVANLIQACMLHNPKQRPGMEKVHEVLVSVLERENMKQTCTSPAAPQRLSSTQASGATSEVGSSHYTEFRHN